MNTSDLELAMLAAIAAEASGLAFEPGSASGVLESVSMILNLGISSIAYDLSLALASSHAAAGATDVHLGTAASTGIPFITPFASATPGTFPVTMAPSMPTAYNAGGDAMGVGVAAQAHGVSDVGGFEGVTATANDDEGSYVFPTLPGVTTPGVTRGRRAPRRWAGWE